MYKRAESCSTKQYTYIYLYTCVWYYAILRSFPSSRSVAVTQKLYVFIEYLITRGYCAECGVTSTRVSFYFN